MTGGALVLTVLGLMTAALIGVGLVFVVLVLLDTLS